ncbi:CTP synthetase [Tabrizicola aquatica]|uniref:CTP synthetase n=1 Tax=Tabrizicola aquatica TaxID=909926 RepID=UPI000CD3221A|nr:CTP synthetase [Tabrizicola aquatica]
MRLFMLLYTLAATAMAGTGVIVVLTLGMVGVTPILVAAALGAGLALPVAWLLTRELG